jgi:hypothetical protein
MSFEESIIGKTIFVQLTDFQKIIEHIIGKDWLDIDKEETVIETDINTKVWFRFDRASKEAWMEVAI